MKKELLPSSLTYYKANLHTHTTISDGEHTPEQIKEAYMAKGYQVIAFTDHDICLAHPELQDENFVALTAYELNIQEQRPVGFSKCYHLNLYAKDPGNTWQTFHPRYLMKNALPYQDRVVCDGYEERVYDIDFVNQKIAEANEKGFLVCYNHPVWSLQDWRDYSGLKGLWGTEVFNTGGEVCGYKDHSDLPYQDLLGLGNHLVPVAADDNHNDIDRFGGWVRIGAEALTYANIIQGMENGMMYASTGPEIFSLTLEDQLLTVTCSECTRIQLNSNCRFVGLQEGEHLQQAVFDLSPWFRCPEGYEDQMYFRLTLTDSHGNRAYTRAYWRSEL